MKIYVQFSFFLDIKNKKENLFNFHFFSENEK